MYACHKCRKWFHDKCMERYMRVTSGHAATVTSIKYCVIVCALFMAWYYNCKYLLMCSTCVFTQSITPVRILVRASQSVFYTDESVWTGPESSPSVRSGPRFYHGLVRVFIMNPYIRFCGTQLYSVWGSAVPRAWERKLPNMLRVLTDDMRSPSSFPKK